MNEMPAVRSPAEEFVAVLEALADRLGETVAAIERVAQRVTDLEAQIKLKKDKDK